MIIPYELQLFAYRDMNESGTPIQPITFLHLDGELWAPHQKVAARFHEDIALSSPHPMQGYLEIPLDILTVARIEHARIGDLAAALKFRALVAVHAPGTSQGVQKFVIAEAQANGFSIPKSHWIERILPQLGYGRLELLEVRLSPTASPDFGLPKAVSEIRQARDFIINGDWEMAVTHCRMAIESIPDSRPLQLTGTPSFALRVDTFVNEQLGSRVGTEQGRFLAERMKSLWAVCSKPVHASTSGGFKRPDAEFIVRNTTAIVEYVGRLFN
jgi:hypothetical protein